MGNTQGLWVSGHLSQGLKKGPWRGHARPTPAGSLCRVGLVPAGFGAEAG